MVNPNRKKRIILTLLGIIFLGVFGFFIYNTVFYPADETAQAALGSDENVIVSQTGYGYFFDGPSEENLLIFYPGAKVDEVAYAPLIHNLAEKGMDVCLVHMPFHFALYNRNKAAKPLPDSLTEISVYGSEDGVLNFDKLEENKKYAPAESYYYVIQGGNHAGFGNYGPQHGDSDAEVTKEEQQKQTVEFIFSLL